MRPTRLLLDGFGSYQQPCELDLSESAVLAICGPNGAGKSTLMDAMLWALYGTVFDRGADDIVNETTGQCRVELDLEIMVGNKRGVYQVTRERSKGRSKAEIVTPDGATITSASAVTATVSEILNADARRLSLTAFARQGAVSAFADLAAAERRSVLTDATVGDLFEGIDAAASHARNEAREVARTARLELEQVTASASQVNLLKEELVEVRLELEEATDEVERLRRLSRGPTPAEIRQARKAAQNLAAAHRELSALQEEGAPPPDIIPQLETLLTEATEALEAAEEEVSALADQRSSDQAAKTVADTEATQLQERLDVLEQGEDTACWVCGGELREDTLEELRKQAAEAHETARSAAAVLRSTQTEHSEARQSLAATKRELSDTRSSLADAQARIAEYSANLARLEERVRSLDGAEEHLAEMEEAAESGIDQSVLQNAEQHLTSVTKREGTLENQLAEAEQAAEQLPAATAAAEQAETGLRACEDLVLASSPHGVPLIATMRSITAFQKHANDALSVLTPAELRFTLSDHKRAPEIKIEAREHASSSWRDYRLYSGGERMRFDIAMRVALGRSVGIKARILCLDEGWGALDSDSARKLQQLMWRLVDSGEMEAVWTVSHTDSALDAFEDYILVERTSTGSHARLEVAT